MFCLSLFIISSYGQVNSYHVRGNRGVCKDSLKQTAFKYKNNIHKSRGESLKNDWESEVYNHFGMPDLAADGKLGEIKTDNDGNIVVVYTNGKADFSSKTQIKKISASGDELWINEISDNLITLGQKLAIDTDNNIFVSGRTQMDDFSNKAYITKYNGSGDKIWYKELTFDNVADYEVQNISVDGSNNIWCFVSGSIGIAGEELFFVKFDNDGNILFQKRIESSGAREFPSVFVVTFMPDNSIWALGSVYQPDEKKNDGLSLKIDTDGNIIENKSITRIYREVQKKNDNLYGVAISETTVVFSKMELDGTKIWDQFYSGSSANIWQTRIDVDNSGNVYTMVQTGYDDKAVLGVISDAGEWTVTKEFINETLLYDAYWSKLKFIKNQTEILLTGNVTVNSDYSNKIGVLRFNKDWELITENYVAPDDNYPYIQNGDFIFSGEKLIACKTQFRFEEEGHGLFVSEIDSEGTINWTNLFQKDKTSNLFVWGADLDSDNNMILGVNSNNKFKIIKQDTDGTLVWEKEFFKEYDDAGCADIAVLDDNSIVAGGNGSIGYDRYALIVKTDKDGNDIWDQTISVDKQTGSSIQYLKKDLDGNIIVVAQTSLDDYVQRIHITKLNPEGDKIWDYMNLDSSPNGSSVYSVEITPDNDIVFMGMEYNADFNQDLYAERISKDGEKIWEYRGHIADSDLFSQSISDNDGNTYFAGESRDGGFVYKIDNSGELVWDYKQQSKGYYYSIALNQDSDKLFINGTSVDFENGIVNGELIALDTKGEHVWTKIHNIDGISFNSSFMSIDQDYIYKTENVYNTATEERFIVLYAYDFDANLIAQSSKLISVGDNSGCRIMDVLQTEDMVGYATQSNLSGGYGYTAIAAMFRKPIGDIAVPMNLSASFTNGNIELSWNASETQEVNGYNIYYSTDNTFDLLEKITETTYTHTSVASGTHKYFIRALVDDKESESTDTVKVVVKSTSIINNYKGHVQIYPVPAKDHFTIEADSDITSVKIYNLSGNVVYSSNISSRSVEVNVNDLSTGIYLVKLTLGEATISKKIILE